MKIKNLNLISYGKFENREITLSNGFNIIKGSNEAGKSTVLSFIKAMLYGFSGRGNILANDRKHYLPWGKQTLSGTMELSLDSGKTVKISRTSGKSQGYDKLECFDVANGDDFNFIPENEVTCNEDAFLKTLCIKQLQTAISGEDDEISRKLINLIGSGNEDISAQKSEAIITDYIKKFKALRGEKGLIFDLQNQIADINLKISESEQQRLLSFEKIKEKKSLADKIKQCKDKLLVIKKYQQSAKNQEIFERLDNLMNSKKGLEGEISSLKTEISQLEDVATSLTAYKNEPPEAIFTPLCETASLEGEILNCKSKIKSANMFSLLSLVLAAIFGVLSVFYLPLVFTEILFVTALVLFLVKSSSQRKKLVKAENDLHETETQNNNIKSALNIYGAADIKEFAEKKAKYTSLISELEILVSTLETAEKKLNDINSEIDLYEKKTEGIERVSSPYTADELAEEERDLNIIFEDAISRSSHIDGFLSAAENEEETPDVLVNKRTVLIEKLDRATAEHDAATLALDAINDVFSQMRSDFTPLVNGKASEYLSLLTGGSIDKIYIDKKFSVTAEKDGVYDLSYFSLGTSDQTYLAIRLAVIDLLFGKDKPIFIDDAFLQYDEEREKTAFKLLSERAKEGQQIIFFTCRPIPEFEGNANIIDLDNLN